MKVFAPAAVAVAVALIGLLAGPALAQERGRADKASQSAKERRIALVIGNSQYKMGPLRNPVNDARAIAKALGQTGFSVSLVENAGKAAMRRVIREFGEELKKGGIGLFYFAGHGIQIGDRNFLVPVSAQIESADDIEDESVDADLLLRQMDTAQNPLNIVILDACRNNPFPRGSRSTAVGLAEMRAPTGTLVAFATAPGSVASDGEGANGVYAKHLADALARPGLTIEQVFKQVRVNVTQDTKNLQVPWESSSLTGEFYFRPPVAVAAPGASPNLEQTMLAAIQRAEERGRTDREGQQRQMDEAIRAALERQAQQFLAQQKEAGNAERARLESTFWDSVKGSADPNDFKAYLERYPDGTFAALAKNRIAALSRATQPVQQAGAAAVSAASPARPATPMAPAVQVAQPAIPAPRPIQLAAARPTSQTVPGELKGLPEVGDSWTYALMDLRFKPNDRSQLYTHTVTAVAENSILESVRKGRADLGDFAFSNEMVGVYRGGSVVETMPYIHLFSKLKTRDHWEKVKVYGTESISSTVNSAPFVLDRGEVIGSEKITVPAGTFDAFKVQFSGQDLMSRMRTSSFGNRTLYRPFTQTVWYAPAVKRIAKILVDGFDFTEVYELQSYTVRSAAAESAATVARELAQSAPTSQPIQIAAARPTSQAVPAEAQGLPKVGDSWTYALMDLRYRPNDRSNLYTHKVIGVAEDSILESVRQGRAELEDFTFRNEMVGRYRGGSVVETMPYMHLFRQLKGGDRWEKVKIYGMEAVVSTISAAPFILEQGEVLATEKITVPSGTFDAFKVQFRGQASNRMRHNTSYVVYSPFIQTVWYAPAVKRVAKILVEGFDFTEAYELQSYALQ